MKSVFLEADEIFRLEEHLHTIERRYQWLSGLVEPSRYQTRELYALKWALGLLAREYEWQRNRTIHALKGREALLMMQTERATR